MILWQSDFIFSFWWSLQVFVKRNHKGTIYSLQQKRGEFTDKVAVLQQSKDSVSYMRQENGSLPY
jgi:hypothetical protein